MSGLLARVENLWIGRATRVTRFIDPKHVYADDLDLFGRGSLFELLSTARTGAGEQDARLVAAFAVCAARFDLAPEGCSPKCGAHRSSRKNWRSWAMTSGPLSMTGIWRAWGTMPLAHFFRGARPVAFLISLGSGGYRLGVALQFTTLQPFLYVVLAEIILRFMFANRSGRVLVFRESSGCELQLLASLLERLEKEAFSAPALEDLRLKLVTKARGQRFRSAGWSDWSIAWTGLAIKCSG